MQFRAGNNEASLNEVCCQFPMNQQPVVPGALLRNWCPKDRREKGDSEGFGKDYSMHRN